MVGGAVECGPNAVLASAREGYRKSDVDVRDLADALTFPGLWRFLARYPSMSWREVQRSFSRDLFCGALQRLVPEIRADDLLPGSAGVRAQAMLPDGDLVQDFYFLESESAVHVLNAPSPGATASLAIGNGVSCGSSGGGSRPETRNRCERSYAGCAAIAKYASCSARRRSEYRSRGSVMSS